MGEAMNAIEKLISERSHTVPGGPQNHLRQMVLAGTAISFDDRCIRCALELAYKSDVQPLVEAIRFDIKNGKASGKLAAALAKFETKFEKG